MRYELSIFKFNCKTDYLPYYKRYNLKLTGIKDIRTLLQAVPEEVAIHDGVVVNGLYMSASTPIERVVEKFGSDLVIEPISQLRVMHDLQIDERDFVQKRAGLDAFFDDELRQKYGSYKLHYYASISLKYNREYIGDAMLAVAKELLQKNRTSEREILEHLFDPFWGLQYHVSSENKMLEYDHSLEENYEYVKQRAVELGVIKDKPLKLEGKHEPKSREIKFKRGLSQPMPIEAYKYDKDFAYKIAGEVLLEAMDHNIDAVVVSDEDSYKLLRHHQKKIARVVGREVDIEVVSA
ncbi:MAG: hypothetical protein ACQERK_07060 [Campylobacterota bacterium]